MLRSAALVLLSLAIASPSFANVTYTYTGRPFAAFIDSSPPFGSYTSASFVTIHLEFASPLPPNLVLQRFDLGSGLLGFRYSDGRFSWTDADTNDVTAILATDGAGAITQWSIVSRRGSLAPIGNLSFDLVANKGPTDEAHLDQISVVQCAIAPGGLCGGPGTDLAEVRAAPGTGSVSAPEPVPATGWLGGVVLHVGLGVAGVMAAAGLRRRSL